MDLSFGVKNLRRLRNVEPLKIKPITLLVGRNSSGKSTFLRALPLLRQSLMTKTNSPILWWDDHGVDFGDFRGAVSNNEIESPITFSFGADKIFGKRRFFVQDLQAPISVGDLTNVLLEIDVVNAQKGTRISSVRLKYGASRFSVEFSFDANHRSTSIKLDGEEMIGTLDDARFWILNTSIFSKIYLLTPDKSGGKPLSAPRRLEAPASKRCYVSFALRLARKSKTSHYCGFA